MKGGPPMMNEQATSELIDALTRRHYDKIEQLMKLFESEGGPGVFDLASKVIGNPISAADWLTTGQVGLDGAIPAVVALDAQGRDSVRTYLQQIEYGLYV